MIQLAFDPLSSANLIVLIFTSQATSRVNSRGMSTLYQQIDCRVGLDIITAIHDVSEKMK